MENTEFKSKSFWSRPEGTTGALFMAAIFGGIGYLVFTKMLRVDHAFYITTQCIHTIIVGSI